MFRTTLFLSMTIAVTGACTANTETLGSEGTEEKQQRSLAPPAKSMDQLTLRGVVQTLDSAPIWSVYRRASYAESNAKSTVSFANVQDVGGYEFNMNALYAGKRGNGAKTEFTVMTLTADAKKANAAIQPLWSFHGLAPCSHQAASGRPVCYCVMKNAQLTEEQEKAIRASKELNPVVKNGLFVASTVENLCFRFIKNNGSTNCESTAEQGDLLTRTARGPIID